jgi:hypothetical protein
MCLERRCLAFLKLLSLNIFESSLLCGFLNLYHSIQPSSAGAFSSCFTPKLFNGRYDKLSLSGTTFSIHSLTYELVGSESKRD